MNTRKATPNDPSDVESAAAKRVGAPKVIRAVATSSTLASISNAEKRRIAGPLRVAWRRATVPKA